MAKNSYKAADIEVLEGLDPVRRRPGMYIGGTEQRGLQQLVIEILDNAVDEAMNGHATEIKITLHKDGESITVEDNGRGIPVDKHPKFKKPALEIILTTLHAGGKFSDHNYVSAGGLHGVGASVVNALSDEFVATVCRDGFEWTQSFSQGKAKDKLKKGKKTKKHGTKIFFRPDAEIFTTTEFVGDKLEKLIREKAFLNKGLVLEFDDQKQNKKERFCYSDGLKSFLDFQLKRNKQTPIAKQVFAFDRTNGIKIELAFCWTEATSERISSYVNGIYTAEGGSHEDGFKTGLVKGVRNYISVHNLLPRGVKLTGDDVREGLLAVVSVNIPGSVTQLQFQGQTKDKLNNPEVTAPVDTLARTIENEFNQRPKIAAALVERILLAAKARSAARQAAQSVSRKVGVSYRLNLPGKLADCSSNRPDKCELFIVEGDSAGGSAKQGRDRKTQAVLPLRGKILNTVSASAAKLKENKELSDLVSVLGCGFADNVNLSKLRYGKVIILTDADADGMHIASLLMAFFFRFMKPLVEGGNLYMGMSPLYRIKLGAGGKEESFWVYSDEEKDDLLKTKGLRRKVHITRFKGLGEMNPKTLWNTTLNPNTRKLLRIRIEDELEADNMLKSLMGRDTSGRYQLIQENAHRLELDL